MSLIAITVNRKGFRVCGRDQGFPIALDLRRHDFVYREVGKKMKLLFVLFTYNLLYLIGLSDTI